VLLAKASAILDAERCGSCGRPKYVCQNVDNDIAFRVYEETCYATRERVKHEEKKKDAKDRAGVSVAVEPYTYSRTPLEDFRLPFYEREADRASKRDAARPVIPREGPPTYTPEDE
jgi:hypothetical protein